MAAHPGTERNYDVTASDTIDYGSMGGPNRPWAKSTGDRRNYLVWL